MLYVRPDAELRRWEIYALHRRARRAESAIIILVWRHRAAIAEKSRFLQRLRERHVRPHAFALAFLIVVCHEVFGRHRDIRVRIDAQKIMNALLLRRHWIAHDIIVREVNGHHRAIVVRRMRPVQLWMKYRVYAVLYIGRLFCVRRLRVR